MSTDWRKESEMFDNSADYYDKYRPSYPSEIINKLISTTGIKKDAKLLEIGSASGKATELFVNKGLIIQCIEPGKNLVRIGNSRFPNERFTFTEGRFEECDLPQSFYDVVFSAQAFHWIPQPIGYEKCAHVLKANGYLALFWNMYITYDTDADNELLELSNKYGGIADFLSAHECEKRIQAIVSGITDSNLFEQPQVNRCLWEQSYTADEYYGFALTGNRFLQKSDDEKAAAYNDIKKLAENHGGVINRPYLCVLYTAKKLYRD